MPSFSLRRLSSMRSNKAPQNLAQSVISTPESSYVIPLSLSLSTSTLGSVSSNAKSSAMSSPSDYAEMMDDDNLAWGPTKPRKSKKASYSKRY
ncbi:hypothetical protein QCA50_001387 [Cerrena zonata]|uniref:Uncharacterized protein n=1 Tax=Cerrena zonata TaxID=2478898 RepID=A0AAW0GNH8_9APHY